MRGPQITDAGLAHLTGIHTLNMNFCFGITDAGLAHLAGIHTLNMGGCTGITDAGLAHLAGVQELRMTGCDRATIFAARALGLNPEVEFEEEGEEESEEDRSDGWLFPGGFFRIPEESEQGGGWATTAEERGASFYSAAVKKNILRCTIPPCATAGT